MKQAHLYLARYLGDESKLKIGRSDDPLGRMTNMGAGHDFRMELLMIFPGKGYLEGAVHKRLEGRRCQGGRGKEWFAVSQAKAFEVIMDCAATVKRWRQPSLAELVEGYAGSSSSSSSGA